MRVGSNLPWEARLQTSLPIFVFDSQEEWYPVGVEQSLEAAGAKVPRSAVGYVPKGLLRERLGSAVTMDFPPDMVQPHSLQPVVYHREVDGGGLVWDQYWLWYLYNPKCYAGIGKHEGDWEFVQVGRVEGVNVLMTASQHQTGGKREYWMVEKDEGRPVIYVARDSHANYFAPLSTAEDVCDGNGIRLSQYEVREFGRWIGWHGRWGNSTGEGRSPETPSIQGNRWRAPHLYHSSAR